MKVVGLSESSSKKNADAINGPLSVWADMQDFSFGSLSSVIDLDVFNALAKKLNLPLTSRSETSTVTIYRVALNKYREYLISVNKSLLGYGFGSHSCAISGLEVGLELELTIPKGDRDAREKVLIDIIKRRGQQKFRSKLIAAYGTKCTITGCAVIGLLEAALITPYSATSINLASNSLLLRSDIHTLWDLGLIAIDPLTLTVWVNPELADPIYLNLVGSAPFLPVTDNQKPSTEALKLQWGMVHLGLSTKSKFRNRKNLKLYGLELNRYTCASLSNRHKSSTANGCLCVCAGQQNSGTSSTSARTKVLRQVFSIWRLCPPTGCHIG